MDSDEDEQVPEPSEQVSTSDQNQSNSMPLQHEYTFWVFMKSSSNDWKPKPIAHFKTVGEFWSVYQHLKRPSQLEAGTMINLFIKGI